MKRFLFLLAFLLCVGIYLQGQGVQVTGKVTSAADGSALPGVSVVVQGTTIGAVTDFEGNYSITVPDESATLMFSFVGMSTQEMDVGGQTSIDISLSEDVFGLDEVVVTGVASGTSTRKLGFAVGKVSDNQIQQVPATSAANAIRGKVSGVRIVAPSGNPQNEAAIRLRGSTSISGSQAPLIIVDGIITSGSLSDINMEDVKSIEIVKGAAASALYGSQAGNGVIQILTKRGPSVQGKMNVSLRAEYGTSQLARKYPLTENHYYQLDDAGEFVLSGGSRVDDPDYLVDNVYPGQIYDHQDELYTKQPYQSYYLSVGQRFQKVNYHVSGQFSNQGGILDGMPPYKRTNFRTNVDLMPNNKFKLSASVSFNQIEGQRLEEQGQGGLFYYVLTIEPHIDLLADNPDGTPYIAKPAGHEGNWENPLYVTHNRIRNTVRDRFLGGLDASYRVTDWLKFTANVAIDRSFESRTTFYKKGYLTALSDPVNFGSLYKRSSTNTAIVGSVAAFLTKSFGNFNTQLALKYLGENYKYDRFNAQGTNFTALGVETLDAVQENRIVGSYMNEIQAEDYFVNLDIDYMDKYILSGLIRRDGSSLFGENERWQTYWRASGAYRISEDIEIQGINELKIRASYGVSGQRPPFAAQYETYEVSATGISPDILGNKDLKPSEVGEFEVGIDLNFLNSFFFQANYAKTTAQDQFILVPLSKVAGFRYQWQNAGTVDSDALELTLGGSPVKGEFTWDFNITWDKITQEITELNLPPWTRTGLGALDLFRVEEGKPYGTMYGNIVVTSMDDLTTDAEGYVMNDYSYSTTDPSLNYTVGDYVVNSDGYVILRGTENTVDEHPLFMVDDEGSPVVDEIGNTNPLFNMGITNTFSFKGFQLYTLLDWVQGGDIYNYTKQLLYFNDRHGDIDLYTEQGKRATYFNGASKLYNRADPSSHFIEDGTYLKIREVALTYTLDGRKIGNGRIFQDITIGVTGRNLYTFTNYSGFDPEVALNTNPTNFRLDEYSYPNFRVYTISLKANF